ncbi:Hemerythrin HHE cation binding domain protein [Alkaliphilus metalliredigens QYMF]|uniref:Hemerythrin HHE cation binding domain protein n=1 Tax=Alkaliphilus metalliredigens (strain QYMF) TaxID=293826 RepID=A6TMZ1_ALKMQ|nr:hemerythrin domain-containing protein [Alkaliphilus metalliredigens]ABR47559.1 Hemerythrin HHE cation binding domain protein [Alkaliphilus metalliredigens QYMF]
MKAIQVLRDEHQYILRMLKVVRGFSIHTFKTQEVYYKGFHDAIDFIRNYADKFHHGKEEDILFLKMSSELGKAIEQGPIFGMLAEHDLGRLHIKTLEEALHAAEAGDEDAKVDIIANAISYTDLLYRHIDKEDNAIFNFAESQLSQESLQTLDVDFEAAKERLASDTTEKKYVQLLEELEATLASL